MARRIVDAGLRRISGRLERPRTPELPREEFARAFTRASTALGSVQSGRCSLVHVPGTQAPWLDSGIDVEAGEDVSWFANGRVHLSKLLDMYVEPHFQLWGRIGDGDVFRGTRATHTFTATSSGRLQFASYFPGQWSTPAGEFSTAPEAWKSVSGAMDVAVVRWRGAAPDGLRKMARAEYEPAAAELERLRDSVSTPRDWSYLWFLGAGEIYDDTTEDGHACIACDTRCDVGILRKDVDIALTPETTLAWRWNVDALPSQLAEDSLPTHDYLSIAVEYDNGIDVTYYWSAELPVGEGYWCPLPYWDEREYHIVVRSGSSGLGQWHSEQRRLLEDYRHHVGDSPRVGAPATRIKRVWLIANSIFQRRRGSCRYAEISVGQGGERTLVL